MATNTKIKLEGKASYARLTYGSRDLGGPNTPPNIKAKLESSNGKYLMNLILDKDMNRVKLKALGIPTTGMVGQLIKDTEDGGLVYKCQREHQRIGKRDGKVHEFGPPEVYRADGGVWDWEVDGLIGNGSRVSVTINVWNNEDISIVSLDSVKVLEHVPYEKPEVSTEAEVQTESSEDELDDEIPF